MKLCGTNMPANAQSDAITRSCQVLSTKVEFTDFPFASTLTMSSSGGGLFGRPGIRRGSGALFICDCFLETLAAQVPLTRRCGDRNPRNLYSCCCHVAQPVRVPSPRSSRFGHQECDPFRSALSALFLELAIQSPHCIHALNSL